MLVPPTDRMLHACCVIVAWVLLCLWAWRQARRRAARQTQAARELQAPATQQTILVAHASQTGQAEAIAHQTAEALRQGGLQTRVAALGQLDLSSLQAHPRLLIVASTYGEGDPPDSASGFVDAIMASNDASESGTLNTLHYAILALGDSEYHHFCGFGRKLDAWFRDNGATPLFDLVEADNADPAALRHWQHHLGLLAGRSDLPDWETPAYRRWTLAQRTLLNPGSHGGPCFHLSLTPPAGTDALWQAGDIAEIGPRATRDGTLLAHREYSIASVPADGAVHLLVRQMRHDDGTLGLGSGWLTQIAHVGDDIDVRLRANSNFHLPADDRPILLIGNGTGLAGLRALLKARIAARHHRNWLIFGERNAAHDWFHREEIEGWLATGKLERLDAVFSRDSAKHRTLPSINTDCSDAAPLDNAAGSPPTARSGKAEQYPPASSPAPERQYVQHRLLDAADAVREWIASGADIYVCGSLQGMAQGVDDALAHILGPDGLTTLRHESRYRRDVY